MIMSLTSRSIANDAARDPALLFSSSVGEDTPNTRDTGLVLTKDQIKNLKRYEVAGLALPTQLNDVVAYLGYRTGAGRGLEAADFQKTFSLIHDHASLWNPLRTDLLTVGDKLVVFAGAMQVYGASMQEVFDDMRSLGLIDRYDIQTLEDLRRVEKELGIKFPSIEKADRDDLGYYLDQLREKVLEQEAEAQSIKTRLDEFGKQLANRVLPEVKQKAALINNNTVSDEIKVIQARIDQRALEIEEKNKEYKELVKQAITGITVNLILVIYSSVQAENIRKERNKLRDAQEADIRRMNQKNRILASLARVRTDLQDLDLIVVDADLATQNLRTVWNKLKTFISESSAEVKKINDALSMRRLRTQINLVVEPWKTIEVDAYKLLNVFAEADREYREEYGV
ncbi:alpha-xenorhabdolysin family binary toxin subunit A [Pseudomonas bohemica]|uniref:alpha-xenorhabdolysin family binary toxin subunit A n=1 Tax=Pseudomonas bohemica TaxID=2044872 RepID=UPI0018FE923C|nr:alpha-xenorhabdolysin family binary toxin subunit A [Pseudomonas bohemica]